MIKVKVSNINGETDSIVVTGHADYAEYGKDIVCSAVSSIIITTVNAILLFNADYISYDEMKDKFVIKIKIHNELVSKLIANMLNILQEIENNYPKNIKIRKENLWIC